jgi:single-stranded-DNA-specific exonuclease
MKERFTSVVYQENWHKGVIGIVASRLIELTRPTLVLPKAVINMPQHVP